MEDIDLKLERQKFQMMKGGLESIAKALESLKEEKPEIDLSTTNEILNKLVDKINEPLCVKLVLK